MPIRPVVSPHDQSATFVELFFDLVFVFCITQIVALVHHDLTWGGVGKAILVFWLVWWAWTQFTWALNAADTEHPFVEFGTLIATAVAFFMAVSIPGAYGEGGGLRFAIPYVLVRGIGLAIYAMVAWTDPGQRRAVIRFGLVSTGGLAAAVVGGLAGGETQVYLWGLLIFLDIVAALIGGAEEGWNLHAEHFAERHGLIVIIALGESLIVAAAGLTGAELDRGTMVLAVLAVLTSCALWWTYFPVAKPELERAMARRQGASQAGLARDVYSLLHFPMLCGVIAYAVGLEEVLAHPHDPMNAVARLGFASGVLLFVGGMAVAMWRATCGRLLPRIVLSVAAAAAIYVLEGVPPAATLAVALAGVTVIALFEERAARRLSVG